MNVFNHAVNHVLNVEGGESNDPDDAGGWTRFGISEKFLIDAGYDPNMEIDIGIARSLYHEHFWIGGRCGELPDLVAFCHFDAMVNHRPRRAKWLLQKGLGVKADGIIGPITIKAAHEIDPFVFWKRYVLARTDFYWDIRTVRRNMKYVKGWWKRLVHLSGALYVFKHRNPSRFGGNLV